MLALLSWASPRLAVSNQDLVGWVADPLENEAPFYCRPLESESGREEAFGAAGCDPRRILTPLAGAV
jgi:hypothetical protein